jgi:hypothetical protein
MMAVVVPELQPEVIVTDGLCEFDRSRFGLDELPADELTRLGRQVADAVAARL